MKQRFAALLMLLVAAILLTLIGSWVRCAWTEGFRGTAYGGHSGHSGHGGRGRHGDVRYGIAHHDRGGRVHPMGHGNHRSVYYGGGGGGGWSWWPYWWPYWPEWWPYWWPEWWPTVWVSA